MLSIRHLTLISIICLSMYAYGQHPKIDSLVNVLNSTTNEKNRVDLYNDIAFEYVYIKYDSIKPNADKAIALANKIDYPLGIADAKKTLAIYYYFLGDREQSFDHINSAIRIFKLENDSLGIAKTYNNLATLYKNFGLLKESIKAYDSAIYFNKIVKHNQGLVDNYINLAGVFIKQGDYDIALKTYMIADSVNKIENDLSSKASIKSGIGLIYEDQGKFDAAITLLDESLKIFERLNMTRNIVAISNNIANIAQKKGEYLTSIEYFNKALETAVEINNPRMEAILLNNLANNYTELNDVDKALELYNRAADIIKGIDDYAYAATLSNIALILDEKNDDQALKYLEESFDLYRKMDSKPNMIGNLNQLANYHFNKKDYTLSKDLYLKAKELLKTVDSDFFKSSTWIGLCKTHLALSDIDSAQYYGNEALKLAKQTQLLDNQSEITKYLYEISKTKNNPEKALEYLESHIQLKDSLFDKDKSKALGKLEAELDFKNQNEKLSLERETEKRESAMELRFRKNLILTLACIVLGLTIIVILLFAIKRQKAKTNRRLQAYSEELHSKNEKLKQLHIQKNRMISIISHDFRGPLNNLSDFLDLYLNKDLTTEEFDLWLPEIKKSIESTQQLIENLVSWAKQSLNEYQINKEEINLFKSTSNLIELYNQAISDKRIKIENKIPEDAHIYIDRNTLDLAIRNIMSNAIKYCNKEDRITFSYEGYKDFHKVCIEDTGIGMNGETAEKLFNSDLISAIGTGKEVGTGIGALLSKNFVEENGGTIWVDYSEVGKGTRICFQVPVKSKK